MLTRTQLQQIIHEYALGTPAEVVARSLSVDAHCVREKYEELRSETEDQYNFVESFTRSKQ